MKKTVICLIALLGLLCLLCGCMAQIPAPPAQTPAPQTAPAPTQSAPTELPPTEPPARTTEATEPAATEPPQTEPAATEPPQTEPAPAPAAPYRLENGVFTNDVLEFRYEDESLLRRDLASGQEEILFLPDPPDGAELQLIGVSDERLYFGWNQIEDWWGVNVYSVDHAGQNPQEYGGAWDPEFQDGWLALYGFRSDVSPTELLLINSRDEIVVDAPNDGSVWDGTVLDGSFYYVYIDIPYEEDVNPYQLTDVPYQVIRVDPDGSLRVLAEFRFDSYYRPSFFDEDGKVNFYSENPGDEVFSYDPRSGG